jgi:excinuclease UvrABC nuclease subunit
VIEILSNKHLSLSNLYLCSSITSFKYIFYSNNQYSLDDENKFIKKFLPDLICLYRNNEHDLSIFFSSYSFEYTFMDSYEI